MPHVTLIARHVDVRIASRADDRRRHAKWATMPPLALREFAVPVMLQSSASPNVALRSPALPVLSVLSGQVVCIDTFDVCVAPLWGDA
ncbi:hypothetical protein A9762_12680 [Pandoraea sp. ISTKB]|nr:hypothetical protein A9762_12680 [Pandoraea sp. ISTKB]